MALVPKERTALVVVDVQNDFCAPDGLMAQYGCDLSAVDPAVDRIAELADAARRIGLPVVFVRLLTAPETDSKAMLAFYERQGIDPAGIAVCRTGTYGAGDYRLSPQPGDYAVAKQRYSAFIGTNFDLLLSELGVERLVVTGVTTECCVESTVRDGFMLDYETFVVRDACAAYEEELHAMSLKLMAINFATLTTAQETMDGWAAWKGGSA